MTHPEQEALSVSEVLSRAADLLEKPGAWIQGPVARNEKGRDVFARSPDAVCWCAMGAIKASTREYQGELYLEAVEAADPFMSGCVPVFNDAPGRTQAEVVSALRAASEASQ